VDHGYGYGYGYGGWETHARQSDARWPAELAAAAAGNIHVVRSPTCCSA
jgi:hypothetical protein